MFHARTLSVVSVATLIALSTTAALAQSETQAPRRGRFLDILSPGQHVRVSVLRPQESNGIEVTLVSEAAWEELAEGAEEIKNQISELEAKSAEIRARDEKLEKQNDATVSALRRRSRNGHDGPDTDALIRMHQAQDVMNKLNRELRANQGHIGTLRRKLPSSYYEITIVGADYFAVDKGNILVCYPANRISQITILQKLPENEKAEEHQAEDAKAKPAQKNPSRADHAKPKE